MRYAFAVFFVVLLSAACAGDGRDALVPAAEGYDSPIPGTIGIAVADRGGDVVVTAVRADGAAARAEVREGDRIRRCNGQPVTDAREFERRVLESRPGSVMQIELSRGGALRRVALPVEEILTAVLG
jgi:S1-C subfamily serine protease